MTPENKNNGDLSVIVWPLDIKVSLKQNLSRITAWLSGSRIITTSVVSYPDRVLSLMVIFEKNT